MTYRLTFADGRTIYIAGADTYEQEGPLLTFFDNAGLVVQNPSAMVKLETGIHVYGGFARYETKYNYTDLNGGSSADSQTDPSVAPHIYAVYNNGDMAVGTGANLPFNSSVEWPEDWAGRDVLTRIKLATLNQPIVVAGRFGDFSVGGGLNFYAAHIELDQEVIYSGTDSFSVTLGGKGTANGYNASILYDGGTIAAAANYTSRFNISGDGDAQFDTSNAPPAYTNAFPDGGISVDVKYPDLLEMAVSWKSFSSGDGYIPGAYAIEAGLLRSGWSAYDEIVIRYDKGLPSETTVIKQNWEDVVDYKIGGFYTFTDYLKVRGGYYKTASPIPESTLGPTTPDGAGRNSFFVGAGYKRRAFLMDLAYLVSDFLPSTTRTNPDLTGKYKGNANVMQLSAGYSF